MNASDLIAKLAKLQIEQDDVIHQSANRAEDAETETKDKKPAARETDIEIHKGDHVLLLTGGVLCSEGDRARITKVTDSAVCFVVLSDNHHTHKTPKNVRKMPPT
jgi:hypothetical protein